MTKRRNAATTVAKFAEATNYALISIDSNGDIEIVNPSACALFGYKKSEMIGRPITIIVPERLRGAHLAGLARVASGEKPHLGGKTVEVSAVRKDGTEFPIEITLSIWRSPQGFCAGAVIKDISERRERESRLVRLASKDTLTGLHNKYQFMQLFRDRLSTTDRATAILIDLDSFKEVNDIHGHAVGDALLQAAGVRLSYMLRPDATVARVGGDEFAVLLPEVSDPLTAQKEAAHILEGFRKPFQLGGLVIDLTVSAGLALAPLHGRDEEELMASADFALYRAKDAGGRCYRLFDQAMRNEAQARRAMRDELRKALHQGQLEMFYQPQIRLSDRRTIGFEALIRWNHPAKGLLGPAAFLPALEQSALALEIGWWTLDQACRQIARLRRFGEDLKIGVNLFPAQLRALSLSDKVADVIERHRIRAGELELEVTEEAALNVDERSLGTLTDLRAMGVGIAFDDFGTGFASLSCLQRYPLTTLKIDRGFIRDIQSSKSNAAIARALVSLSHDLGLEAIAEGIETAEQEAALLALGCPAGQGYRYGRPMPQHAIEGFFHRGSASMA